MHDHEPIPNGHHRCPSVNGRFVADPDCGRGDYAVANDGARPGLLALECQPAEVIELENFRTGAEA